MRTIIPIPKGDSMYGAITVGVLTGNTKYTTNNTKSNISDVWIDFKMFGIFNFIYIYSHYNFRELREPTQGTYGSPNPSLSGNLLREPAVPRTPPFMEEIDWGFLY